MPLKNVVLVKLGLDDKEFNARLRAATTKLKKTSNEMLREGRRLSIASRELFMGLVLPAGLLGKTIFDATAQMEKMTMGLETIAKSKGIDNISQLVEDTKELAKLPGLGLQEAFKSVTDLVAVGKTGGDALRIIKGIGIGIARAGGAAENFNRVMIQMIQGLSKGKLMMQDFRTIFEQLPEARGILERTFGTADLDSLRKMGVAVDNVIKAISGGFKELGAQGFMNTFANQVDNLKDSWLKFRASIGEKFFSGEFKGLLSSMSLGFDKITGSIAKLTPRQAELITGFTKAVVVFGTVITTSLFMLSRFRIMQAMMLKFSPLAKTLFKSFSILNIGMKGTVTQLSGLQLMALRGSPAMLGLATATKAVGKALRFLGKAIPILGELYIIFEMLRIIFPGFDKKVRDTSSALKEHAEKLNKVTEGYKQLNTELEKDKISLFWEKIFGKGSRMDRSLSPDDQRALFVAEEMERINQALSGTVKGMKGSAETTDDFKDSLGGAVEKVWKLDEAIKELSKTFNTRMRNILGLGAPDPLRDSSQDQAAFLFSQTDRGGDFMVDPLKNVWDKVRDIPKGFLDRLTITDEQLEKFREWGYSWERIAEIIKNGEVLDHFEKMHLVAGAIGEAASEGFKLMGVALSGMISGLEGWEKQFTRAVVNMVKKLVALIAKLAIAAALMAIVFPGAGGLSALSKGTGAFGAGGKLFGKGGFLKALFAGLGIPGFAEGAVVPPGFPNDSYPALLTSGEKVVPPGKPLPMEGGIRIVLDGQWKIRGRDLAYLVEENQKQIKGVI